ncbi:MAG: NTP transferase domain-containing protein [Eubacterium sp.]|nr:NTP transferase domain-containing protein [Eubacterium sp.]
MEKYVVNSNFTVKQTIEKMENELIKGVVVLNDNEEVIGLFTNGDMRSFFMRNGQLSDNITLAMNDAPKLYYSENEIYEERKERIRLIYPIVDINKHLVRVVDFENPQNNYSDSLKDIPLVIMAGGKGTRLYPYTKILPKPLLPIGDETITERIIGSFTKFGCRKVIMILNYKSSMIKSYFDDIKKDYDIQYVEEKDFLGTGGGLKLIRNMVDSRFFLSNCDILIDTDFSSIVRNHIKSDNKITFVCSMKNVIIPYGVIKTDKEGYITEMREKPDYSFMVNTGLYLIEPEVIDNIGDNEFIHLPELAERIIKNGNKVGAFPVSEQSWMDMGQFSEMEDMKRRLGI